MRPVVAALAVMARGNEVLLVRRANPPDAGLWGLPGGKFEFGETLEKVTDCEAAEETGVGCVPGNASAAFDLLHIGGDIPRAHCVLVDVECQWIDGEPVAADDALEAAWISWRTSPDDET